MALPGGEHRQRPAAEGRQQVAAVDPFEDEPGPAIDRRRAHHPRRRKPLGPERREGRGLAVGPPTVVRPAPHLDHRAVGAGEHLRLPPLGQQRERFHEAETLEDAPAEGRRHGRSVARMIPLPPELVDEAVAEHGPRTQHLAPVATAPSPARVGRQLAARAATRASSAR